MALWGKTLAVELDGLSSGMLGIEREREPHPMDWDLSDLWLPLIHCDICSHTRSYNMIGMSVDR